MSAIGMPGYLLALFAARPPLERVPPIPKKTFPPYTGLSDFLQHFETDPPPPKEPFEPPKERKERLKKEKALAAAAELKEKISEYDPHHDPEKVKTADPRKTLFVGRLSYETSEKKLLRFFEAFGPVRDVRVVTHKKSGAPRGYAFVEFKSVDGLRAAFREAYDRTIDGRKIVVDLEKGRVAPGWLPRRLGGGEGPPRCGVPKKILRQRAQQLEAIQGLQNRRPMMSRGGRPMPRGGVGGRPQEPYGRGPPPRMGSYPPRDDYRNRGPPPSGTPPTNYQSKAPPPEDYRRHERYPSSGGGVHSSTPMYRTSSSDEHRRNDRYGRDDSRRSGGGGGEYSRGPPMSRPSWQRERRPA